MDDPEAPQLIAEFTGDSSVKTSADIDDNDYHGLFMFPDKEWVQFLKSKGYEATSIGQDVAVFDNKALKPVESDADRLRAALHTPEQQEAATAEQEATVAKGSGVANSIEDAPDFGVYQKKFPDGSTWYGVKDPNGAVDGKGNQLLATPEDAQRQADRLQKEHEYQQRVAERQKATALAEEEATKQRRAQGGFTDQMTPMQRGRVEKSLQKKWNIEGKHQTAKQYIEDSIKSGKLELETQEENRIKDMTRMQNFRASNEQQQAHEAKVKAGGKVTKYLINGYDFGKIAYDYAQHLSEKAKAEPTNINTKASGESAGETVQPTPQIKPADKVTYKGKTLEVEKVEGKKVKLKGVINRVPLKDVQKIYATGGGVKPESKAPKSLEPAKGLSKAELEEQINDPEFKQAEIRSRKEKVGPKGFTKTQQSFLGGKLADYGKEHADELANEYEKGKKGDKLDIAEGIKDERTIVVPDDGTFSIKNLKQASRLHQRLTGQPLKGLPKDRLPSLPASNVIATKPPTPTKRKLSDVGGRGEEYDEFEMSVPIDEVHKHYLESPKLESDMDSPRFGKGWVKTTINGKPAWTDGVIAITGEPPSVAGNTIKEPETDQYVIGPALKSSPVGIKAVAAVDGPKEPHIRFDNGAEIPFDQYNLIIRRHPDATFEMGDNGKPNKRAIVLTQFWSETGKTLLRLLCQSAMKR